MLANSGIIGRNVGMRSTSSRPINAAVGGRIAMPKPKFNSSITLTEKQWDRFWRKVVPEPSGCWRWVGAAGRYGYVGCQGRNISAHRLAYRAMIGEIPVGLQLDHLCRNQLCVNPTHLEPVTNRVNSLRGVSFSAVNARKTHCKRGHPFPPDLPVGNRYCLECRRQSNRRGFDGTYINGLGTEKYTNSCGCQLARLSLVGEAKYIDDPVPCQRCGAVRQRIDGAWLRRCRQRLGLTSREVARRAGVSAPFVCHVELNKRNANDVLLAVYGVKP